MTFLKSIVLSLCLIVGWSQEAKSQKILTIDLESTVAQSSGQLLLLTFGINVILDNGVDVYRVTYEATGSDMLPDTASGLLMLPDDIEGALPLLVYQHGTTDGRDDVPSNLRADFALATIFAGKGMAVLAPDYLGMGTSRGFHPYVHAETEATAAVDMMDASLEWMSENDIAWNEQVFITGYSQGGHAAMALHKYIEEVIPDRYQVAASLPMSGPYSISGVMKDLAFTDEPYNFPAYLVYSTRAIQEIYPSLYDDESQIFKEPFLPVIEPFISTGSGLGLMNQTIVQTLITEFGAPIPKQIFKDSILNILENEDDHLFNVALRESDVFDWAPVSPVLMLYCPTDDQVPFRNSIIADSVMNLRGAVNTTAMDVSDGRELDHADCAIPALNVGVPWLLSFIKDTTTPTIAVLENQSARIYPNPTSGLVFIDGLEKVDLLEVYDISGKRVMRQVINNSSIQLDLQSLSDGMYLTHLYSEAGVIIEKLMIQ